MKPTLNDIRFEGKKDVLRAIENQQKQTLRQKIDDFLNRELEVPLGGVLAFGVACMLLFVAPAQGRHKALRSGPAPYTITVIEGGTSNETHY